MAVAPSDPSGAYNRPERGNEPLSDSEDDDETLWFEMDDGEWAPVVVDDDE